MITNSGEIAGALLYVIIKLLPYIIVLFFMGMGIQVFINYIDKKGKTK